MNYCPQTVEELDELASAPDDQIVAMLSRSEGDLLVAGAGGKMGFHLALMLRRALNELGSTRKVYAVSRFGDHETRRRFEEADLVVVPSDLTQAEEVAKLPDAGAVFFLAGKKFGTSGSSDDLTRFNVEMPGFIAERFKEASLVALSTGCVYPFVEPTSGGSVETDAVAPVGDYALSCLERERVFLAASERFGTPLSLIRLNYSVDLRYGVLVDVARKVVTGTPVDLTTGYFNCLWQGDAVAQIIRSLEYASPAPEAAIFNVTGPQLLKVREVAETLGELMNRVVTFTGEEAKTAWLSNSARALSLLGPLRVPEDTLIEWVAEWVGHGRPLLEKPTHFEVRDGNF